MWEQVVWILASPVGFILVWFPGLGSGSLRTIVNWIGIAIFSIPWFWLPFTAQPHITGLPGIWLAFAGYIFFIFGFVLCGIGSRKISEAVGWAGHAEPSRLVTDGIYRYLRHPVYSGLFIGMLGWALIWNGVYSILLLPVLLFLLWLEAWLEEKLVLEKKFGEIFHSYRNNVPAFFPSLLGVPLLITAIFVIVGVLVGWFPLV